MLSKLFFSHLNFQVLQSTLYEINVAILLEIPMLLFKIRHFSFLSDIKTLGEFFFDEKQNLDYRYFRKHFSFLFHIPR